jgi:NAD(P)-dependent dehydrogenase (short-subunit alcohol dehydrogenase family)
MNAESLKGRVVIVTGRGHGLGASLARAAAARGAAVVVNCRADGTRAQVLAEELSGQGRRALAVRADVADYAQATRLVAEVMESLGRIDVLFNTVGSFLWKHVADMGPAEWRDTVASNLDSVFNMCRLVLPAMRQNRYGRIVSLGAVGAERALGQPEVAAYSAAKAAVIAFSRSLALEEARGGITVNVVCPGVFVDGEVPAPTVVQRVPVGRAGTHDDIIRAALFFASPAADFVTGQVLSISGGEGL